MTIFMKIVSVGPPSCATDKEVILKIENKTTGMKKEYLLTEGKQEDITDILKELAQ